LKVSDLTLRNDLVAQQAVQFVDPLPYIFRAPKVPLSCGKF
jgi:hypothetical protein